LDKGDLRLDENTARLDNIFKISIGLQKNSQTKKFSYEDRTRNIFNEWKIEENRNESDISKEWMEPALLNKIWLKKVDWKWNVWTLRRERVIYEAGTE
jgi:hypothetical protein